MKEMKTFDEILIETHASISRGEMMGKESKLSFRDIERLAAKEYVKQWIDRATDELNDVGVGFPEAYKRVMELKKEIDAQ